MSNVDDQYAALLRTLLEAPIRQDRTGTGTRGIFGHQMRFNLEDEFPLLTTKRVWWKGVVEELLWFLTGSTNNNDLTERGVHIWDEWAGPNGELGPIYGKQWRNWNGVDQIDELIDELVEHPYSRRHVVSAWNVTDLPDMALSPCHCLFQMYIDHEDRLSCQLYQRSADVFLGVPFNIASYALLTHILAQVTGLKVGELIWTGGDVHLYLNHVDQAREQLAREGRPAPTVTLDPSACCLEAFEAAAITLHDYNPHSSIKAEVSV
jgi:thymidylate synthase